MNRKGEEAGDVLDAFIGALGMPRSLGAVGIGPENFDVIANQAMNTPWVPRNPRRINSPSQVREILELAA
jgi:maleylacetate reductase